MDLRALSRVPPDRAGTDLGDDTGSALGEKFPSLAKASSLTSGSVRSLKGRTAAGLSTDMTRRSRDIDIPVSLPLCAKFRHQGHRLIIFDILMCRIRQQTNAMIPSKTCPPPNPKADRLIVVTARYRYAESIAHWITTTKLFDSAEIIRHCRPWELSMAQ